MFVNCFYRTRVWSLATLVTHWVTDACLVDLIVVTLACEDANLNNLMQIWTPKFGHKVKFLFRIWAKGLVEIFRLKLVGNGNANVWLIFWSWSLIEIKMKFDQDLCKNLIWTKELTLVQKRNSTLGSVVPLAMFSTIYRIYIDHQHHNCFFVIIIIRPKPVYSQQGPAGGIVGPR